MGKSVSLDSSRGERQPKGLKVGEPYTRDAATRNQSTEGQGNVKSGTRTHQATNLYRSKWEAAYANKLELEKRAGVISAYWYEPFSLWLPGKVRYKPDFLIDHGVYRPDAQLEIVEVKGWSKNRRDGMTRLKIAAALFPCFTWRMVYRTKGGGWDGEYL